MTALFSAITCFLVLVILICGVIAYVKARNTIQEASEAFNDFFTCQSDDSPSPFLQIVGQVSELTAQKIGVTTQMAIKGSLGGTMKGVNAELEQVAAENDPSAAMLTLLPKSTKKNPLAMAGLNILIQRLLSGGGQGSGFGTGSGSNNSQTKFNL